jgi:succinate dehydrogenase / fumarate reductase cytochrome b subunit
VAIIRTGLPNTGSYPYEANFRYTLQRATAWIALFFIGWHVFHMHGWVTLPHWREQVARTGLGAQFDPEHASSSVHAAMASLWTMAFYLVGVAACVFHFANGLWTMGITWGAWTSPAAQRRAGRVCLAVGILVMFMGVGALWGVRQVNAREARKLEEARLQWKHLLSEPPLVQTGGEVQRNGSASADEAMGTSERARTESGVSSTGASAR